MYRKTVKKQKSPFRSVSKNEETVCVQLPHGRGIFRSAVVRLAETTGNLQPDSDKAPRTYFSNEVENSQEVQKMELNEVYVCSDSKSKGDADDLSDAPRFSGSKRKALCR